MSLAERVVGVNPVQSPDVSEEVTLQIIALPSGTFTLNVPEPERVVQFEPPSNEYSTLTYAVPPSVLTTLSVEVADPPEQLPSDCEAETVIGCGQSTVELSDVVEDDNPVKSPDVSEEVTLQIIVFPSETD